MTPDYTPYIAQIGNVDCVFNGFAGSNPVKFMRAYADLGLKGKIPLLAGWTAMDDALLKSLGDEAVGVHSAHWYSADGETASNKRFVAAMQKDYDNVPGGYAAGMYIAGQCVEAATQKAGGQAADKKAFMDAVRSFRQCGRRRLHPKMRAQGRGVGQRDHQDLSERQPVLDL